MKRPAILTLAAAGITACCLPASAQLEAPSDAGLVSTLPGYKVPTLKVGDDAPKLAIAEWVRGEPISDFEDGRIYVVEFWATWCGPCIRGMPHLTKLQDKYQDDVTIIGVNIWDGDGTVRRAPGERRIAHVSNFVDNNESKMGYHVAIETANDMSESWMLPADKTGIPSAFIVSREGKIAWIGHPAAMDEPLEQIVNGELDVAAAAAHFETEHKANAWMRYLFGLIREGKTKQAYKIADSIIATELAEAPNQLNEFAWTVATHPKIEDKNFEVALKAAQMASAATDDRNPSILDTLARVHWEMGNADDALKYQELAVKHNTDEQFAESLQEALNIYRKGKGGD